MNNIILPGQEPSREVMKAAGDFMAALMNQWPAMAKDIKDGFNISIIAKGQVLFSLGGDIQIGRPGGPFYPGQVGGAPDIFPGRLPLGGK